MDILIAALHSCSPDHKPSFFTCWILLTWILNHFHAFLRTTVPLVYLWIVLICHFSSLFSTIKLLHSLFNMLCFHRRVSFCKSSYSYFRCCFSNICHILHICLMDHNIIEHIILYIHQILDQCNKWSAIYHACEVWDCHIVCNVYAPIQENSLPCWKIQKSTSLFIWHLHCFNLLFSHVYTCFEIWILN